MTVITAQVRTGVLAGGWDRGPDERNNAFTKGRLCTSATTAHGAARTRTHALTNRRVSDTQAESHANDHLTDINLAPNEPFTVPITDYCYFM